MSELTVEVQKRELVGKNANRRLRETGQIPAVVYGGALGSFPIQVDQKKVRLLMRSGGDNAVFQLQLQGTEDSRHAMIRAIDIHPISRKIIHIDFLRIDMTEKVKVRIAVELEGVPEGVKTDGGVLDFMLRDIEVECLPGNIPTEVALNVDDLMIGDHVEAGAIELPKGVVLLEDPTRVIVSVSHAKVEEESTEEDDELLTAGGTAEPQIVGKEDEEAEEG